MQRDALEKQYVFRHYTPETDMSALSHMLTVVESIDHDGEDPSEAALREQLTWPNHHPEQDCWVMEAPDTQELIGYSSVYAQTVERSTLYVAVHPNWRRRGLGSVLLAKALDRAREVGARYVTIYANARNMAANAFLKQHGLWAVSASWVLLAPANISLEEPAWLAGYTIRNYSAVQHLPTLVEVMNRSYSDKWGHSEKHQATSEELVMNWLTAADPEGIFLVFAPDGSVAGFCRANRATGAVESGILDSDLTDQVEQPGVVPEHRHQGLYRPLTLTAMYWLRSHGQRAISLQSWGDDEQTIAGYCDIGFTITQHWLAYQWDFS